MSTIASPRDAPPPPPRPPSLDLVRPGLASPGADAPPPRSASASSPSPRPPRRSNRAALREYYRLRSPPCGVDVPDSEVPPDDLDAPDFDAAAYVADLAARTGLEHLLRVYTRVVAEARALDAEKKALVYDNYSKLIAATETIRKMRANMDSLKPLASTLDPAIAQIYSQASSIWQAARETVPAPGSDEAVARDAQARRRRTRCLAAEVLATPQRLRDLVRQGSIEEARSQWELPRRLLVSWRDRGVGGDDVQACIDQGDTVFAPPTAQPGSQRASGDTRR